MSSDKAFWEKICAGNPAAFEELFQTAAPRLYAFLRVYSGGQADTEDIVQETFLQLWKRPGGYDPERGTLRQYLYGIARKRLAQKWRDFPATPPSGTRTAGIAQEPAASCSADLSAAVRDGLMHLDADARALLLLREVEGYAYHELAEILGVPVGTIKSRLFNAREDMRQLWLNGKKE